MSIILYEMIEYDFPGGFFVLYVQSFIDHSGNHVQDESFFPADYQIFEV